jgi:Kelch motif protein/galactose oxidase-like protein
MVTTRAASLVGAATLIALAGCAPANRQPTPLPPPSVESAQPLRARAAHTATLLADGRVLLAGGCVDDGCSTAGADPSSELYVPGRGFVAGPAMRQPRDGHTATMLADGRVLLVGGWPGENRPVLAAAEVFDPGTNVFTESGSLGTPRGGHVAARLPDGRVLIAGGWVGSRAYTDSVELFDPATNTFTAGPPLPEGRHAAEAIALRDGRILLTGGADGPEHGLASAFVYRPDLNRWRAVGPMGTPRFKHAMAMLPDGRVLVLGGTTDDTHLLASTEVFDPATDTFAPGPAMDVERYKITESVAATGTGLLVAGGTQLETYDARTARFRPVPGSQQRWRSFATATALADGSVLIVGGYDDRIRPYADATLVRPGS